MNNVLLHSVSNEMNMNINLNMNMKIIENQS